MLQLTENRKNVMTALSVC